MQGSIAPTIARLILPFLLTCCTAPATGCRWLEPPSGTFELDSSQEALLANDGWVRRHSGLQQIAPSAHEATTAKAEAPAREQPPAGLNRRWMHPDLEAAFPSNARSLASLAAAIHSDNPIIAANAAMLLIRGAEPSAVAQPGLDGDASWQEIAQASLVNVVRGDGFKLGLRAAAVESLAMLQDEAVDEVLREMADEIAGLQDRASGNLVELHAELLVTLLHRRDLADLPRFVAGLASSSAGVRAEALKFWLIDPSAGQNGKANLPDPLPNRIVAMAHDSDSKVRATALAVLAAHQHPKAEELAIQAVRDSELAVRQQAIECLGRLGTEATCSELRRLLEHHGEIVRAEAARSLALARGVEAIAVSASDPAWRVRREVARSLAACNGTYQSVLARQLLRDASSDVQRQTVQSVANWPLPQAGPVLLAAMAEPNYELRKLAGQLLAARWPPAQGFSCDTAQLVREESLRQLRSQFEQEFALEEEQLATGAAAPASALGLGLAAAQELSTGDRAARRIAADRLAELASLAPLPAEVIQRLPPQVMTELDPQIWRGVLAAIAGDESEATMRIVHAALSHPDADIRRRASAYLERHPAPANAAVLLRTIGDQDSLVSRSALRALAATNHGGDLAAVEAKLLAPDKLVRLEAAVCLARLKVPRGPAALERLSHDDDPAIRRQVAASMGELKDPVYLPALIRLLDDQGGVSQAALASLAAIAGSDIARATQIDSNGPSTIPASRAEEISRWKLWHAQRQQAQVRQEQAMPAELSDENRSAPLKLNE